MRFLKRMIFTHGGSIMATSLILLKQVVIMFLLAAIGFIAFRAGKITSEGSKTIGNLLIYVSLPAVIVKGFMVERTPERMIGLAISMLLAAAVLGLCILISRLCFGNDVIASFAAAFSNPGFFGIPLITAVLDDGAVFYIAPFIAFLNMLQWSYGVSLITGRKNGLKAKTVFTAPFMIAILVGLALFFSQAAVPELLTSTISLCAGLNTPLAMFAVGVYLAQCRFSQMLKKPKLYAVSAVRLVLIPLAAILVMTVIPGISYDIKCAVLIAAACPVGSNIAVYAELHHGNYTYAVETVAVSTILCIVTIPLIVQLAGALWL